ncbi:MAG TPA: hypothetical protein ENH24_04380, partial [Nitrospirae bacterium]|nr:hypothetical protein [Nitrospirota bacterium]
MNNEEKLTGKLIVQGKIKNVSPVIVGSGMEDIEGDILVVRDWKDNFYIPATSFAGVLRHKLQVICNENPEQFEYFWGAVNQSAMILKDLVAD